MYILATNCLCAYSSVILVLAHLPKCRIYASVNGVSIGSGNGLSPVRRQTITWTNADVLSIWPLRTNFSEIWIEMHNLSFTKMHLKVSSAKWRPFYSGGDELISLRCRVQVRTLYLLRYAAMAYPGVRSKDHYNDVIMRAMASQITSLTIDHLSDYSGADQRKYQSPASLALWGEFTGDRWIPRTNGQLRGKCFHLMTSWYVPKSRFRIKYRINFTPQNGWFRVNTDKMKIKLNPILLV